MIFKMPVVKIQENTKFINNSRSLFTLTLSVARLKMLYEEQKWMWITPETFFLRLNTVLVTRIKWFRSSFTNISSVFKKITRPEQFLRIKELWVRYLANYIEL